jgi:hypothetical protein
MSNNINSASKDFKGMNEINGLMPATHQAVI